MTANQFGVAEHYSYDMIGTIYYALVADPRKNNRSIARMDACTLMMASPTRCRYRRFPDYQFNAQEFAKR